MSTQPLTAEQETQAQELLQALLPIFTQEALALARLLASKDNDQILGKTEFDVRDSVHRLGAKALQTAIDSRKKGGTKAPA